MCFLVQFFLSSYKNRKKIIKIFLECWRNGEFFLGIKILNFDLFRNFDFGTNILILIVFLSFCDWFCTFFATFFNFGVLFCKSLMRRKIKILLWHRFLDLNKDSRNYFKIIFGAILRNFISWHPGQEIVYLRHEILITRLN